MLERALLPKLSRFQNRGFESLRAQDVELNCNLQSQTAGGGKVPLLEKTTPTLRTSLYTAGLKLPGDGRLLWVQRITNRLNGPRLEVSRAATTNAASTSQTSFAIALTVAVVNMTVTASGKLRLNLLLNLWPRASSKAPKQENVATPAVFLIADFYYGSISFV